MRIENLFFRPMGVSCHARKLGSKASLAGLQAVVKLLSEARSSIKIVTGEARYEVYNGNSKVLEALKQARDECTIDILVGPDADAKSLKALASLERPMSLYQLSQWPPLHFIVVDKKHVRLEEAHLPGQKERVQYIIYNFEGAERLDRKFNELTQQAALLDEPDADAKA